MNKILILCAIIGLVHGAPAYSAVREGSVNTRPTGTTARSTTAIRTATPQNQATRSTRNIAARSGALRLDNTPRIGTNVRIRTESSNTRTPRRTVQVGRTATTTVAGTPSNDIMETRTGAEYARCKSAYFQCMDQFCQLKNDDYRRCSCSSRIYDLMSVRQNIINTNSKITEFTENLDAVGLTAAQATAMHTASDGENALTADTSASKALLTAIMNSIRGGDTTVGGKMSDLNSINLSFDTVNMFGLTDTSQVIASYNGTELYNAVYPSCRSAVADDCNNASLQRAVTAYLMAIEQDCNTVQNALENKQKDLRAAVRESSAMLDLARIENRNKHNSDNMATCIANVESAILSEQVCGSNYHRCLDNGEFIDVTTGAPITGIAHFYELQNMLKFDSGTDAALQKLAQNPDNREFVRNFENKTKKFATDALDKCTEIADSAWAEYLDKALLDIYYAQRNKVQTIKTGCLDLISQCYTDRETAITAAMSELIDGTSEISLLPDKITLTRDMCNNYIESCNNMFDDTNIIAEYVEHQTDTDTTAACRAVVQQCFDSFGGSNYENFYYVNSGLFQPGIVDDLISRHDDPQEEIKQISALDWFTLYSYDEYGIQQEGYVSKCAQRVADIPSCADKVESVFGGLDAVIAQRELDSFKQYNYIGAGTDSHAAYGYGWAKLDSGIDQIPWNDPNYKFKNRRLRPTGVATEVYNQIIDTLQAQCMNMQGKFIEAQFVNHYWYSSPCELNFDDLFDAYQGTGFGASYYGLHSGFSENMCPKNYAYIDTSAWGGCSCWENGGRRSRAGMSEKCMPIIPAPQNNGQHFYPGTCDHVDHGTNTDDDTSLHFNDWCIATVNSTTNQVCPFNGSAYPDPNDNNCDIPTDNDGKSIIPIGI
ncbi:MAG: hypothetical protein J6Y07_03115 [Alphaproteobacteria bacterium]|nr:hypothetical protein [Alphaproteobacteria bacterium]